LLRVVGMEWGDCSRGRGGKVEKQRIGKWGRKIKPRAGAMFAPARGDYQERGVI